MKQSPYQAPPQSEGAAQQNAAIAAEHERETFLVDERADPVRQLSAVIGNPRSVAKPVAAFASGE
jgi:hypothetical protein